MKVIDFFGMPGIGKTTKVEKYFLDQPVKIYIRKDVFASSEWLIPFKRIKILIKSSFLYYKLKLYLPNNLNRNSSLYNQFKECLYFSLLEAFITNLKDQDGLLVLDHGFGQIIIHLIASSSNPKVKSNILEILLPRLPKTELKFIFLSTGRYEEIINRIQTRKEGKAWFDSKGKKFLKEMLEQYDLSGHKLFMELESIGKEWISVEKKLINR